MDRNNLLNIINTTLDKIDYTNQITLARQEGFNQGYKACLEELKKILEASESDGASAPAAIEAENDNGNDQEIDK